MTEPKPFTFNPDNPFTLPASTSSSTTTNPFTFSSAPSSTSFSFSSSSASASSSDANTTAAPFSLNSSFAAFTMGTPEKATAGTDAASTNSPFTFESPSTATSTAGSTSTPFTFSSPAGANFTFSAPADVASPAKSSAASAPTNDANNTTPTTSSAFTSATFQFTAPIIDIGTAASNPFIAPSSKDFEKPVTAASLKKTASAATATAASAPKTTTAPFKSKYAVEAHPEPEPEDDSFPPLVPRLDLTRQYAVILNPEQKILDAIAWACRDTFTNPSYDEILQRIKHFFFHRQFEKVFGDPKHLNVYVAQYLPMRVLCYYNLWSSHPLLSKLLEKDVTIYCIGAGPGSELMGISMSRENILRNKIKMGKLSLAQAIAPSIDGTLPTGVIPKFRIHTQDLFDWEPSLKEILHALITHAPLSYRSTNFTFSNANIMDPQLKTAQFKNSHVVTMMFVLNELFQENKAATMQFLDRLISAMRPGAFLIVADSAGDFSQLEIGAKAKPTEEEEEEEQEISSENAEGDGSSADAGQGAEFEDEGESEDKEPKSQSATSAAPSTSSTSTAPAKPRRRYWIYSLLDAIPSLSIVHAEDSIWYRYPGKEKNLTYPLKFENMRYFLRIYQKKA